jgi:hypothetical protein
MDMVKKIAAQPADGISKTDAVKGQILTAPVPIEKACRRYWSAMIRPYSHRRGR